MWRLELTAPCLQKLQTIQKLTVQLSEQLNTLVIKQGDASDSLATQLDLHVASKPQVQLFSLPGSSALPVLQHEMLRSARLNLQKAEKHCLELHWHVPWMLETLSCRLACTSNFEFAENSFKALQQPCFRLYSHANSGCRVS